ncbi:MAG: hypothetical protein UX10_C0020G0002 [Candidatus Magasanikbacteria bacterium GW2011_GWA2_45_39]|uniref:Protein translocase subunit SecD n=1 Tax=Candidatus Magasanikbacteria bacterium GW2011_GWA2_45_39 TaxID=1619041 RepID=A0A0G1MF47_9BACT|nr:MAG: hypothetical protein UX10_C0020G0002 [Candidatus Magasanikbacteria bacterium GW2011_GWA2_45_39]
MAFKKINVTGALSRSRVRWGVVLFLILLVGGSLFDFPNAYNKIGLLLKQRSGFDIGVFPWNVPFRLGLDLIGGSHLIYEADVSKIDEGERTSALEGVRDVIERRVNAFGVAEPLVQTSHSGSASRVIVELAGVKDVGQAIKMIGETPILEFKEQNVAANMTDDQKKELETKQTAAKQKSDDALKALKRGTLFAAVVKQYSEDESAIKDKGGDVGEVSASGAYADLYSWAQGKQVGAQSDVIKTTGGYEIGKLTAVKDGEKEVQARHILICFKGAKSCSKDTSKEDARKLAEDLKKQATAPNFADLAKKNSTEPGASTSGGELGWFGKGAMVKPFEDAVFGQKVGSISDIVESEFGFHVIYKESERPKKSYVVSRVFVKNLEESDITGAKDEWKNTGLSGTQLKKSQLQFDPNSGMPTVNLEFNDEGKKLFDEITTRNVSKPVAIFLDGQPISIPTVNEPIKEGKAIISGNFTIATAKQLAQRLNAGALPVPITLVSQQTVGASLGLDSLYKSLWAGLIGFLAVALFMILMYRLPGVLATLALLLYTAITLAIFKLIPVTLTLAGIAGFILSIGMAVDANILIFERTKEELRRGLSIGQALQEGFARAWLSIRDSNISSLITCVILVYLGSSLVKGFALTLALGILVSMFSAITVTRILLHFVGPMVKNPWLFLGSKKKSE